MAVVRGGVPNSSTLWHCHLPMRPDKHLLHTAVHALCPHLALCTCHTVRSLKYTGGRLRCGLGGGGGDYVYSLFTASPLNLPQTPRIPAWFQVAFILGATPRGLPCAIGASHTRSAWHAWSRPNSHPPRSSSCYPRRGYILR